MGIRKYNPITPGLRGATVSDFAELTPGAKPEKSLLRPQTKTGGRNNQGKITSRHRGGGHKQQYRMIDFRRNKDGVPAKVDSIQYDPNRSARIALLFYADGEKRYIIAPGGLKAGDQVMSGPDAPAKVGNCLPLTKIPLGSAIFNIELRPGRGGVLCRSAGTNATLMARERRDSAYSLGLPGDDRRVEQFGSLRHRVGEGWSQPLVGASASCPRYCDEPDRPSARRRRRSHQGRSSSGEPDGQERQGRRHAEASEAVEQGDRASSAESPVRRAEVGDEVRGDAG
jgi:hypothetical protein